MKVKALFNFTILIPALIGLSKWRYADHCYKFFIAFIWTGLLNETVSRIVLHNGGYTVINNNIYVLIAPILLILFFKTSGVFSNNKWPVAIIILFISVWIAETFIRTIHDYSIYYRTLYSFVVVLLSIKLINKLMMSSQLSLLKHPAFSICIGLIIYYTLNAFVNSFWVYGNFKSRAFLIGLHQITFYSNIFVYLTYSFGLAWIQKKPASILPY